MGRTILRISSEGSSGTAQGMSRLSKTNGDTGMRRERCFLTGSSADRVETNLQGRLRHVG